MPLLAFRDVSKRFDRTDALRDVSFELEGRSIGLVGPNGAGKTTLMKICLGLAEATSGRVEVLGQQITPRTAARVRLGYAAEGSGHLPHLTGLECVAYAARLCGLTRRRAYLRAHEMLDLVGLDEARHRLAEGYSTGMLQRTKVAMALVHDPELLFLDEPTSGLDPTSRTDFLRLLAHLRASGGPAVVLSTHILHDVEKACEQVLILNEGRVKYVGDIAPLTRDDGQRYRVRLLSEVDGFGDALSKAGLTWQHMSLGVYAIQLAEQQSVDVIWHCAAQANAAVIGLEGVQVDFEGAFLSQVAGSA
ncbi:MAG: ABC transporter ATP-binding protein [Myxococcota bacterium]|nr:ABC transporter ATP-binding protein [Myxococcota bacterium]